MIEGLQIRLCRGTPSEQLTKQLLESILPTYDLRALIFTTVVEIDETAHPHSHPVLTLNTQYARDEIRLLAEFIHEQLHWFEEDRAPIRDVIMEKTRELYPTVPCDPVEGAGSEDSTRLHLLVCNLEYRALWHLLGGDGADSVMRELAGHHYKWVYRTVLRDSKRITSLMVDFRPDGLRNDPVYNAASN